MNILVITSNYPSRRLPNYGAFVYTLLQELGKHHEIIVINPFKVHNLFKKRHNSYGSEKCTVYRPMYLSLGNKRIGFIDLGKISTFLCHRAINKTIRKLPMKVDIVYTHFLYNAKHVLRYVTENALPLVVASGESSYHYWKNISPTMQADLKKKINHIICVSDENKKQLLEKGFHPIALSVIPNAVNYSLFKPLDKNECKIKFNLPKNKFIVGFIGHFIHRKGPNRVIEAIKRIEDPDIHLVCVGSRGQLTPNSFTTELGPLPNHRIPEVLNSFDVFVLPTLSEGHCNVIEEAKACAIPVISSKGTSVETQIDDAVGILVNPLQIDEISNAIARLKCDAALHRNMVENLTSRRGENSISERANKISKLLTEIVIGTQNKQ